VPIIVAGARTPLALSSGRLADVAPTVLDLMDVEKPHEMAGHSLLVRDPAKAEMRA
jgi:2,3-bisphosphoglycerate-independent phosphoglycerate mutase